MLSLPLLRRAAFLALLTAPFGACALGTGDDGDGGVPADARPAQDAPTMAADSAAPDGAAPDSAAPDGALGDSASGDAAAPCSGAAEPIDEPGMPHVDNASCASRARVLALVRAALDGLGFDPSDPAGPNANDRVFVGRRYLAWIDQTGFYGKLNGLWALDHAPGDALAFSLTDPDGRPVNALAPGEDGEGTFLPGYKGGEHVEFPNRVPEPNDPASCATRDWCNQFGLNEAAPITNPAIPWWSACNAGSMAWSAHNAPVSTETTAGGLALVYEGPLVKQADGDGTYDGDACHADYLFPDGVRRRVYLRVGYELYADEPYVDRTMQLRNPAGNPQLRGDMSLIGGFVMTHWPAPYYLKRLQRFWRPETRDVQVAWGGTVTLNAMRWNDLSGRAPASTDVLIAWAAQPITLSDVADYGAGRSATVSNVGPSDNDDVGACLCTVHGAIEMGGGLIHAGVSLPIAGGASTIVARRRLALPDTGPAPRTARLDYDAQHELSHGLGRADADGWSANTAADAQGHLLYGPYARDWGGGAARATFELMVDNNSADDLPVVALEVYDSTADQVLATRQVHRREFRHPLQYQRLGVNADLTGRAGHAIETRLWWYDVSYVRARRVEVFTAAD